MIKKRIILKYLISSIIILMTGCGGKTILQPDETSQNLLTDETMYHELLDEKYPESVPDSPITQEEMPDLAENTQKIKDIVPKQVKKWVFIGKISKEHPTLFRVLTLHTNDMVKSLAVIQENSGKYNEKYLRFLPDGSSVYISKDNELFINKKGGPAPEEVVTVNIKQDNNNKASRPEYKPEEKQSINTPKEDADERQKIALNFDGAVSYEGTSKEYALQPGDNPGIILYNTPELHAIGAMAVDPPALVPKTGQTISYATDDDGDHQTGIVSPSPRFTDNTDGTITDNLTGLVWLKNANCFGARIWHDALTDSNGLNSGECGLTDGSAEGDWRLPNEKKLQSLIDFSNYSPALPTGHPFTNVQSSYYWSSTTYANATNHKWSVNLLTGGVTDPNKTANYYIWPVRDPN